MTFTSLPNLAGFLRRTHMIFADTPWQDEWLDILGRLNRSIMTSAVVGATFRGVTDCSHGEVETEIEITKTTEGAWSYVERPI